MTRITDPSKPSDNGGKPILLEVKNLHAMVEGNEILKGLDLTLREGELHALMGPNGSGKSTLAKVIAGHPAYTVTDGSILHRGEDLLRQGDARRGGVLAHLVHQEQTVANRRQRIAELVRQHCQEFVLPTIGFQELLLAGAQRFVGVALRLDVRLPDRGGVRGADRRNDAGQEPERRRADGGDRQIKLAACRC